MFSLRSSLSRLLIASALVVPTAAVLAPSDAAASVSIAVDFDMLVKDSDVVAVVTPGEQKSVWEDGRIYTYTQVRVERGVAGDVGAGADGWVRTMGGVVGKIGQLVDGEPVFVKDKASLLFMRKFKAGGVFEVSARAQGQYPVTIDEATKRPKLLRSAAVGMLVPPKPIPTVTPGPVTSGAVQTKSSALTGTMKLRLAQEVMHDKPLDDVAREIATAWKRLHPAGAKAK